MARREKYQTHRPWASARNVLLALLALLLLLGGLGYNAYEAFARPYLAFYRSLTVPEAYARTFRRPPGEARRWEAYLRAKSGLEVPYTPENVTLLQFYALCLRDAPCSRAASAYARESGLPWWRWYLALLLPVLPLAFVRLRIPKVEAPSEASWASADLIRERQRKDGSPGDILGQGLHPTSTFLGLVDLDDPASVLEEEPRRYAYLQLPTRVRSRHVLVVAGTGAGKTTTYAMNQIYSGAVNGFGTIVFDQKWGKRSGLVEAIPIYLAYGRPVYTFTPFSDTTMRLPILDLIDDEAPDYLNYVVNVVGPMVVPAADNESVQHYRENDWALLAALIIAHKRMAKAEGRPADLGEIVEILSTYSVDQLKEYIASSKEANLLGAKIFERPPAKLNEAIPGLRNKLLPFATSTALRRAVMRGEPEENLDLAKILQEPALLYVGIPEDQVGTDPGKVLLRLIKLSIDQAVARVGPLPHPYNFILDEFANFGFLPNIDKNLAMIRDQNVSMHLIVQSEAQGVKVYGRELWRGIVENNLQTQVWYVADLDDPVQEELSEKLGERTVFTESVSESRDSPIELVPRVGYQVRAAKKPLLPKELMQRAPRGTALVRLPNIGWVIFRAVTLHDPRNPFHADYLRVRRDLLPGIAALLRFRKALLPREEPAFADVAARRPPDPADRLAQWVGALVKDHAPVKVYPGPRGEPSKVLFPGLPKEGLLPEWLARGYFKVKEDKPFMTGKGFKALPPDLQRALDRLGELTSAVEAMRAEGLVASTAERFPPGKRAVFDPPSRVLYLHRSLAERLEGLARPAALLPSALARMEARLEDWLEAPLGELALGLVGQERRATYYRNLQLALVAPAPALAPRVDREGRLA